MTRFLKRTITLVLALITVFSLLPAANAEAATLQQGSSGSLVRQLQLNLVGLGCLDGEADGRYGKQTKAAVKEFQSLYGLTADGVAGEATQSAIRNTMVRLQVELKNLGYAPGTADGYFGTKTKNALIAFQKDRGLKQTGTADSATWAAIDALAGGMTATSVRKGSSGTQVKYLQQALIGLGYLSGSADGQYGSKTTEAVRSYQRDYGLTADGSAGRKTMTSLRSTIMALQSDLARRGFTSGTINAVYGDGTIAAVKAYQRYVGVTVTGVAGPRTMVKLYGYALGAEEEEEAEYHKTWIDSLYQDGDLSTIKYGYKYTTTVEKSGCAGVSLAMGLNALLDTNAYTGQNVMQWYANNGYYWGRGTKHEGIWKYPRVLGLNSAYCGSAQSLVEHLKKDRLAVALIRDKTGEALFTYSGGGGHYILISGYRVQNGVEQVFVNNPLSYKASKWYDLKDLMANTYTASEGYANPFVIIYK